MLYSLTIVQSVRLTAICLTSECVTCSESVVWNGVMCTIYCVKQYLASGMSSQEQLTSLNPKMSGLYFMLLIGVCGEAPFSITVSDIQTMVAPPLPAMCKKVLVYIFSSSFGDVSAY